MSAFGIIDIIKNIAGTRNVDVLYVLWQAFNQQYFHLATWARLSCLESHVTVFDVGIDSIDDRSQWTAAKF